MDGNGSGNGIVFGCFWWFAACEVNCRIDIRTCEDILGQIWVPDSGFKVFKLRL